MMETLRRCAASVVVIVGGAALQALGVQAIRAERAAYDLWQPVGLLLIAVGLWLGLRIIGIWRRA